MQRKGEKEMEKVKGILKNPKIVISIIGIIIGIVTIFIGITTFEFTWHYNGTVSKQEYGGDAYTGIQNACAQTATNVYNTFKLVQTFSQIFLIVLGALIVLHYIEKLFENIKILKEENKKLKGE